MPGQKPPAKMNLGGVGTRERTEVAVNIRILKPALRVVRIAGRAVLHFLHGAFEFGKPASVFGERYDVHACARGLGQSRSGCQTESAHPEQGSASFYNRPSGCLGERLI